MPHKNSGCPKCHFSAGHGTTKQVKWLDKGVRRGYGYSYGMEYGRAIFRCKWCKYEWEGWGRRRIKRDRINAK